MKQINNKNNFKSNFHLKNTINWNISNLCNLNCSFCLINKNPLLVKKQINFLIKNWELYKKGFSNLKGQWEILIVGGEAFSIPIFFKIVKDLIDMGHKISITTNFSYSTNQYKKFLKIVGNNLCLFLATYKPEYYKLKPYLKKAIIINELVKKTGGLFTVSSVATVKDIDYLYKIGFIFKQNKIKYYLRTEKNKKDKTYNKYTKENIEKIKEFGRNYGLDKTHVLKNKICFAGINYFIIDLYGKAYRCQTSKETNSEYMGDLLQNNIKLFKKPKKCPYESCLCVNAHNKNLFIK